MKKFISFMIAMVMLLSLGSGVFADRGSTNMNKFVELNRAEKQELSRLIDKYNFEIVNDDVDTSNYLRFDSVEEAEEWLNSFKNNTSQYFETDNAISNINLSRISMYNKTRNDIYQTKVKQGWPIPYYVNFLVDYDHNSEEILRINDVSSYLSGFHFGLDWEQTGASKNIVGRNNNGIDITVYGLFSINLIIKDIPLNTSEDTSYSFSAYNFY